ncbi:hypothetical protein WP50_21630 [Lactiplantibacillus plantarum]|nr:hypothetical protein WP50_21630 [Lactiplantibacillus plantarum]
MLNASDQYLMDKYEVDEEDVRLIVPELLLINELLQLTNAEKIWLGNVTVLDGLIIQEAIKLGYKKYNFNDQIVTVEELSKADFQALYEDVLNASDQYLMDKYEVDEEDVRLIVPELLLINELLQLTNAEKIWLGNQQSRFSSFI